MPERLSAEQVKNVCKEGKRGQCPYLMTWEDGSGGYPICAYGEPILETGARMIGLVTVDSKGMPKQKKKPKIVPNCTGHKTTPPFQPFRKN